MASYVTIQEADAYFNQRLHETAWSQASGTDKVKSLPAATQLIDTLSYKGFKHAVWLLFEADPELLYCVQAKSPSALKTVREAEASQELEFPRGADTVTPDAIKRACYEIAYSLLDGVDPDLELENLAVRTASIAGVRTSFDRQQNPLEHIINGIPSATAWKYLKPFLRDDDLLKLTRTS